MIRVMGRLSAGMLVALTMLFGAVASAHAAEIPPTQDCVSLYSKLNKEYKASVEGSTRKERRKLEREMIERLVAADCLSDAEPLLKEMPAKPFTDECVASAKAADRYWKPITRRVLDTIKKWSKRIRPIQRRVNRLDRRISQLSAKDASARRVRPLRVKRRALMRKQAKVSRTQTRGMLRDLRREASPTELIIGELTARRCVSADSFGRNPKGPAAKVVTKHFALMLMIFIAQLEESADSGASISSVAPDALTELGDPDRARFPVPPYLVPGLN